MFYNLQQDIQHNIQHTAYRIYSCPTWKDTTIIHYSHLPNLQIIQMEMGQASSLIGEVEDAIVSHLARISRAYEEKNYHVFEGELASLEKLSPNN